MSATAVAEVKLIIRFEGRGPFSTALRGPYLRWVVFYGSCFEPAVVDRSFKRESVSPSTCP
jgi:hypothetical protein